MRDDQYVVEQKHADEWRAWSGPSDILRAEAIVKLARKQRREVRIVDAFGRVYDAEAEAAYEQHCIESEREYEAQLAAGGRTICPQCNERSVTHRSVVTLGYAGHPGAEFSDLAECERCDYKEI